MNEIKTEFGTWRAVFTGTKITAYRVKPNGKPAIVVASLFEVFKALRGFDP